MSHLLTMTSVYNNIHHLIIQGDTLVSAKKVLLLILHHLPAKCLFNVITFGAGSDGVSVVECTLLLHH